MREFNSGWVKWPIIETKLVVAMRSCSKACLSNIADHVASFNLGSAGEAFLKSQHVSINRGIIAWMLEFYFVSVAIFIANAYDTAVAGCFNRSADRSC